MDHFQNEQKVQLYSHPTEFIPECFISTNNFGNSGMKALFSDGCKGSSSDYPYIFEDNSKVDCDTGSSHATVLGGMRLFNRFAAEKIHKTPIERQDSINLDIGLSDSGKTDLDTMDQIKKIDHSAHTEDLFSTMAQKHNDLKKIPSGLHPEIYPNFQHQPFVHPEMYLNYQPDLHQKSKTEKLSSNCLSIHTVANKHINGGSQCFKKHQVTNIGQTHLNYSSQQSSGNIYSMNRSEKINNQTQSYHNNKNVYSVDRHSGLEKNTDDVTNYCKDFGSFYKERSWMWRFVSANRQGILISVMHLALFILAMGVLHLYRRVEAIEVNNNLSSKLRCQCHKDAQISNQKHVIGTDSFQSMGDDMYTKIMKYLPNDAQGSSHDNTAISNVITNVNNHNVGEDREKIQSKKKHLSVINISRKSVINENRIGLESSNLKWLSSDLSNGGLQVLSSSDKYGINENFSDIINKENVPSLLADVNFEHSNLSLNTTGKRLSRFARSTGRLVNGKEYNDAKRNKEPKKPKGGQNSKSQAESFEVRFYEIFVYNKEFSNKDCTEDHKWGKGITACKTAEVRFQHQYSLLPFYNTTKETAGKDHNKRMVLTNDKRPGEFKIHTPGDYLVQLNITIVDRLSTHEITDTRNNEKHFLALFLNGQAMLACQQGGFRCPHMNHHESSKYKICNIIGLLELKIGDVLDIRTMEPDTTVRFENVRKSYFKVVLLSKTK